MKPVLKNALIGYTMILLSAIGFGSYGIWYRTIGTSFQLFSQGWVRSCIILMILVPIAFFTKKLKPIKKEDIKYLLIPLSFSVFTIAPVFYAFNHMDIGTGTLVFYASFLITTYLVGILLFNEKISYVKKVSLILAFAGLFLVFDVSLEKFSVIALILAAINGIASGGEVSTTKKVTCIYSSLQISIFIWLATLITHLPVSLILGEKVPSLSLGLPWFYMILFSIIALASFWLVVEGFKHVDASVGGLIGLSEVIFAIIFGMLIFKESISITIIFGGILILISGMLPDIMLLYKKSSLRWFR
ncbi:hypothetical protein COV24_00440 [candidate division WWE3 bacterium CG10_big_fil_rev_8_21_14_0_10_32_10]|uniref:EamA domain-containing protein n=1 Tax=candidate division WWE3 bacterium CG10_big_fil_rev_8_21_14_0_10_32_10 TaxID=1975090 RepID=A0A2H0RCU8_UNCKA|nr:MAG: hypothetical protein COV24_00440 [candidate division WWE3 bacterium CG10_big_fil_rev_8_21_14_0_10_32_10]